jgi:hypothetical protein
MRNITYKYEVGDTVMFKVSFKNPSCGLVGREGTTAKVTGLAKAYNNKPHYYLDGDETTVYPESLFSVRYEE